MEQLTTSPVRVTLATLPGRGRRGARVDQREEQAELRGAMEPGEAVEHLACGHVEGGIQIPWFRAARRRASARAGAPLHRQARQRAVERLDLHMLSLRGRVRKKPLAPPQIHLQRHHLLPRPAVRQQRAEPVQARERLCVVEVSPSACCGFRVPQVVRQNFEPPLVQALEDPSPDGCTASLVVSAGNLADDGDRGQCRRQNCSRVVRKRRVGSAAWPTLSK